MSHPRPERETGPGPGHDLPWAAFAGNLRQVLTGDVVERVRRRLGRVGAFIGVAPPAPVWEVQRSSVQRLEAAGWSALWTNEVVGADALVRVALWLAATDRIVVGTCVANVWARPVETAHAAANQLNEAYPHRFVLGLGVGRAEQAAQVGRRFDTPVAIARGYLEGTREATYPRILAANGPKLLAAAGALADGALPAGRPPEATAAAREVLGVDKLLVVYVPFTASDTAVEISRTVDEHVAAGADHVVVGMSHHTDFQAAAERLEALAPDLAGTSLGP